MRSNYFFTTGFRKEHKEFTLKFRKVRPSLGFFFTLFVLIKQKK